MSLKIGQLFGPFKAGAELIDLIKEQSDVNSVNLKHLGINVLPAPQEIINEIAMVNNHNNLYEIIINEKNDKIIGPINGIYEINEAEVTSLKFVRDVDSSVIIDYYLGN